MKRTTPPAHFNAAQKKKWKQLVDRLKQVGTYNTADADVVELYVLVWSDQEQARAALKTESPVLISGKTGGAYPNPWVGIKQAADNQLAKISATLGLTPQSRKRMKLEDIPAVDPDDDFTEFF